MATGTSTRVGAVAGASMTAGIDISAGSRSADVAITRPDSSTTTTITSSGAGPLGADAIESAVVVGISGWSPPTSGRASSVEPIRSPMPNPAIKLRTATDDAPATSTFDDAAGKRRRRRADAERAAPDAPAGDPVDRAACRAWSRAIRSARATAALSGPIGSVIVAIVLVVVVLVHVVVVVLVHVVVVAIVHVVVVVLVHVVIVVIAGGRSRRRRRSRRS